MCRHVPNFLRHKNPFLTHNKKKLHSRKKVIMPCVIYPEICQFPNSRQSLELFLLPQPVHFSTFYTNGAPAARLRALIGAVNESTWEHLKLLFFPALLYTLLESMLFVRPGSRLFMGQDAFSYDRDGAYCFRLLHVQRDLEKIIL